MKNFSEVWLVELPKLLTSELGAEAVIEPMSGLPPTGRLVAVEVLHGSSHRLLAAVDAASLSSLLVAAKVTSTEPDEERDRDLWTDLLRQASTQTAAAFGEGLDVRVQLAEMRGSSFEWYTLRVGENRLPLAVRFENVVPKTAGTGSASADPAKGSSNEARTVNSAGAFPPGSKPASSHSAALPSRGLDLLLDVELEASLRFGSREMTLNEVLDLGAGDVVELERHVADPVDLLVGDKIVARGEVVLVNGCFGLRVTEVAEPKMRLESIRCLF
ncbi:FliM/FliN family flagellar motor C-terminal domain-containing protein [Acidipila rosea]|uniref:Flagellar motor switch protein FliN n=1 Tax=Acidipila rosea TaxID=768535 RepID=A0A4R1LBG4_9BACT|nr:FliM/FliN family flagellar motor C-terminal domain-containing protein [Acidipila rosea]TCK75484.1 flagellar motor switch protein FliN [Acidipila rosea]